MDSLDLSRSMIQRPSRFLSKRGIYLRYNPEDCRLFNRASWSFTTSRQIINTSRCSSLHQFVNHQLGSSLALFVWIFDKNCNICYCVCCLATRAGMSYSKLHSDGISALDMASLQIRASPSTSSTTRPLLPVYPWMICIKSSLNSVPFQMYRSYDDVYGREK